jgi:hypothetical protein
VRSSSRTLSQHPTTCASLSRRSLPCHYARARSQILDRDTIGRIWAGDISSWDDAAIKALNPTIASKLPNASIIIGYSDNLSDISVPIIFKRALESFSPVFAQALAAAGGTFAGMAPALRGTGFAAGTSSPNRVIWLKVSCGRLLLHFHLR